MGLMVGSARGFVPGGGHASVGVADEGEPPPARDPLQQPFTSNSLWNMPIGSNATYVHAGFTAAPPATWAECPGADPFRIVQEPGAPLRELRYSPAAWSGDNRCAGSTVLDTLPMPDDWVVPHSNANEGCTLMRPDGHTFVSCQPVARCTAGGYATAVIKHGDFDIYDDGFGGGHGGSGMSILGGLLRVGDLRPGDGGVPHVLKVVIDTNKYLFSSAEQNNYRWPADRSDANGGQTTIPDMLYGALLALHPSSTLPTTLRTEPGRQMAWTIQNYGAYIVDGTGGEDLLFPAEEGYAGSFSAQFQADYGFAFAQRANMAGDGGWVDDIRDIINNLQVVTNNGPSTIGGGGTPRVPLAPEI